MNEQKGFAFEIEDVFYIPARGTIVLGRVQSGTIRQGDALKVLGPDKTINTTCTLIEKFRKVISEASEGDHVGICLKDVNKADISRGMKLVIDA